MRLTATDLSSPHAGPFTLALAQGECVAITGPSGAGKSLFLRMLADLDPHTGEASVDGVARSTLTAPEWRRRVRYVAAETGWWHDSVGPHFTHPPGDLLGRLNLPADILGRTVALCSTGERQRLALARAVIDCPPVLLLDEPTGALDEDSTQRAEALLAEAMAAGTALVLVTHAPRQAAALGTRRLRIEAGRLLA